MAASPEIRPDAASPAALQLLDSVGTAGPTNGTARLLNSPTVDVAVDGGSIRVYHVAGSGSGRPVVFISGWGTIPESFGEFYNGLGTETEVFHVETREKPSSVIARRGSRFDMDQMATDVRAVMEQLDLVARDPVLMGTCFGSAVVLHGLAHGILRAPTAVCVDPMDKLWMPGSIILALSALPLIVIRMLRPLIRAIVLAGMKEPVQRTRAAAFINSAVLWKWRRAALQIRKWRLADHLLAITQPVVVFNGSHDRFHDSGIFPRVAAAISGGIFIRVPVGESRRERLMGVAATVFSRSGSADAVPESLRPFVVSS